MEVVELMTKMLLYLLDYNIVPSENLRKEKGSEALYEETLSEEIMTQGICGKGFVGDGRLLRVLGVVESTVFP